MSPYSSLSSRPCPSQWSRCSMSAYTPWQGRGQRTSAKLYKCIIVCLKSWWLGATLKFLYVQTKNIFHLNFSLHWPTGPIQSFSCNVRQLCLCAIAGDAGDTLHKTPHIWHVTCGTWTIYLIFNPFLSVLIRFGIGATIRTHWPI